MIYLDNAATTKVFESAATAANDVMLNHFYNPNSTYKGGVEARERIESARRYIAKAMGVTAEELIFTSCATEANNWVFNCGRKNPKGNVVITAGEHASVYEAAMRLKNRGTEVRIAPLSKNGTVNADALLQLIDDNTSLVSVIHVSNETGAVNPIGTLAKDIRKKAPHTLIHSDGVQAFLKTDKSVSDLNVDFYSVSAHKIGAPKGIGLLYVRKGINIPALICGGGQERNLRSGTQNSPYIAAFAAAVEEFSKRSDYAKTINLNDQLTAFFQSKGYKIIGNEYNSGYIICVHIPKVKAEILQNAVYDKGVVIGKGAACSGSKRGNRVLSAIGLSDAETECCIRISLFVDTVESKAMNAAKIIDESAQAIRSGNVK